jgi:hypothetical protein
MNPQNESSLEYRRREDYPEPRSTYKVNKTNAALDNNKRSG